MLFAPKLIEYGSDLEAFAKHAKRSTVLADDVKLLVRRNKGLVSLVLCRVQFQGGPGAGTASYISPCGCVWFPFCNKILGQ